MNRILHGIRPEENFGLVFYLKAKELSSSILTGMILRVKNYRKLRKTEFEIKDGK